MSSISSQHLPAAIAVAILEERFPDIVFNKWTGSPMCKSSSNGRTDSTLIKADATEVKIRREIDTPKDPRFPLTGYHKFCTLEVTFSNGRVSHSTLNGRNVTDILSEEAHIATALRILNSALESKDSPKG